MRSLSRSPQTKSPPRRASSSRTCRPPTSPQWTTMLAPLARKTSTAEATASARPQELLTTPNIRVHHKSPTSLSEPKFKLSRSPLSLKSILTVGEAQEQIGVEHCRVGSLPAVALKCHGQ